MCSELFCNRCESNRAFFDCIKCDMLFCDSCWQSHHVLALSLHSQRIISELDNQSLSEQKLSPVKRHCGKRIDQLLEWKAKLVKMSDEENENFDAVEFSIHCVFEQVEKIIAEEKEAVISQILQLRNWQEKNRSQVLHTVCNLLDQLQELQIHLETNNIFTLEINRLNEMISESQLHDTEQFKFDYNNVLCKFNCSVQEPILNTIRKDVMGLKDLFFIETFSHHTDRTKPVFFKENSSLAISNGGTTVESCTLAFGSKPVCCEVIGWQPNVPFNCRVDSLKNDLWMGFESVLNKKRYLLSLLCGKVVSFNGNGSSLCHKIAIGSVVSMEYVADQKCITACILPEVSVRLFEDVPNDLQAILVFSGNKDKITLINKD